VARGCSEPEEPQTGRTFKSFSELNRYFQEDDEARERLDESSLRFGAVFWIPGMDSGIAEEKEHPWVIVGPYRRENPVIIACMMTTQVRGGRRDRLFVPAGSTPWLDRDSEILLQVRSPFRAENFKGYRSAGVLPDGLLQTLRSVLARVLGSTESLDEERRRDA
jgi:hypothetical protein